MKRSSTSCPSPNSMKIKTLIHSHFFRHVYQIVQALTKAKSIFMELITKNKDNYYLETIMKIKTKKKKKKVFSSIRFHYNWCSSHVLPMPEPVLANDGGFDGSSHAYYDSTWNSIVPAHDEYQDGFDSHLSGYLHWLDEKLPAENSTSNGTDYGDMDEIDRLADKFIASFHEKFRLEKQESYRRYQEMLARSM
ncbi:Protein of unknown function DUF761 [Macleaya cordata]|uniref:Cotton fiber protein n=1 Tax=Macleaya cordata TaxID=56857 RepID=A0A200QMA7_MACCD|nr:Protein of unknown function DUF761 [Macleaya cordata]